MMKQDKRRLWSTGSQVQSPAQYVKDLALLQVPRSSHLWLGSDPWPGNSRGHGATRKEKKKERKNSHWHKGFIGRADSTEGLKGDLHKEGLST